MSNKTNPPDPDTIQKLRAAKLCEKTLKQVQVHADNIKQFERELDQEICKFLDYCERCPSFDDCIFICYYREVLKKRIRVKKEVDELKDYIESEIIEKEVQRKFGRV